MGRLSQPELGTGELCKGSDTPLLPPLSDEHRCYWRQLALAELQSQLDLALSQLEAQTSKNVAVHETEMMAKRESAAKLSANIEGFRTSAFAWGPEINTLGESPEQVIIAEAKSEGSGVLYESGVVVEA